MRKLIDIPDEIVRPLRILAVQNDKSFKKYLEDLLINHVGEIFTDQKTK